MAASGNAQGQDQVTKTYLERRRQMESNYEQFISGLKLYDHELTPQEQLILRVTRLFGECEMAAPPEYLAEVSSYIRKWQRTRRFAKAVARAQQMGYTQKIAEEFQEQNLPPQFFYLAMQESDFDEVASGPPTRMGIAKGMWQFIPETGTPYGLKIGPLAAFRRPDRDDDRHKWEKATDAAARYIKEIYSTDAQASGLLVMASYNWGEDRVINMLRTHAGQSPGAQLLEGARAASRPGAEGNLRLRAVYRLRGGDWRESEAVWFCASTVRSP